MEEEIAITLDVMLAKRKMSLTELSERMGITMANLSILKTGKAKAIRFSTLAKLCEILQCQPGDLIEYEGSSDEMADIMKRIREMGGEFHSEK